MKYEIDPKKLWHVLGETDPEERMPTIKDYLEEMIKGTLVVDWAKPVLPKTKGYSECFDLFWSEYPARKNVKSGKQPAYKAWKKLAGNDEDSLLASCLAALETQKKTEQWCKGDGEFIPMASTWLNQRRWEDEIEVIEKQRVLDQFGNWTEQ